MNRRKFDVVIVGGAVMGSSVAYFLSVNQDFDGSVALVEMDPTFSKSATALSSSSIRHQYSTAINVQISQFGSRFIRQFAQTMAVDDTEPDLCFRENGYLFLAASESQEQTLRDNHEVQVSCGADVELLTTAELESAFPHLNTADVRLASYGRSGEGWFSNTGLMDGFRRKARQLGTEYIVGEVRAVTCRGNRVSGVRLANGESLECDYLVNASGTRGAATAAMAGLYLPVEPRKRTIFIFDCELSPHGTATVNGGQLPLMIDATGTFCRPEGAFFMTGMTPTTDLPVEPNDFAPRYEEFETIWANLASRSRYFEAIKQVNCWAGHYDYCTLDQNAIVGSHSQIDNFIFVNGFSGHGLQQSPAIGRGIAELIAYGEYRSLDLSPLGYERVLSQTPLVENVII